ncbi:hypothetical protein E4U41_004641, partial [Claviceps citrina]
KRARYWLGDRDVEIVNSSFDDDDGPMDDGLYWNRGEDGDLVLFSDDDDDDDDDEYLEEEEEEEEEDDDDGRDVHLPGKERRMSEDVAGRMEI